MVQRATGAAARALLAWVVILGLAAALGYLVSERNSRTWSLVPEEGRLVVMKGLFLPLGRTQFKSSDPVLSKVYAPLVPPPAKVLPEERSFSEQADLDRELFDLLAGWAREDIASADPSRLERGLGYLERALELPALSAAQRDTLAALRAESGYYEARRLIEKARVELSEAAEKLRLTAGSRSSHALEAQALLTDVSTALDSTTHAARTAGGAPAAEAVSPPPPEGRPAGDSPGK